ncbi:MAG TPA: hypothetical protein VH479_09555, partial [Acidimicrobiales bacterium]
TGTREQSQDRPQRSRRHAVVWAGVAAAFLAVAGLAFATFVGGDDSGKPTSVEVHGSYDEVLPGSHNVPL